MSSRHNDPVRILCESTRALEHSRRSSSASRDISRENMPTTFWSSMEAFSAMFMAKAVFPMEGRAAMMIRSERCKPAGHFVQIGVVGGQAGDALAALQQRIDRSERLLDDLLHAHEAAADALLGELQDGGFGVVENFFGGIALVGGAGDGGIGGVNQSAQQRFVADNLDVVLDAGPVGDAIDQAGDVADIADRFEFLVPVELLDQRDHVDRPGGLGQIHHARINAAVGVEREVFRLEMLGSLVVGKIVQQDGAEDGTFGFHVGRKAVRETVVSSSQGFFICLENQLRSVIAILAANCLWTPRGVFGKRGTKPIFFGRIVAQTRRGSAHLRRTFSMENKKRKIKRSI